MKALIGKLLLYAAPFAVLFLLLTGTMIYVGESMPLDSVIRLQMGADPVLYRVRYGNRDQDFKRMSMDYRQPTVITLGSSRALQFRAGMFDRQPDAFYNVAAPAWRLPEVIWLLENSTHVPDVLLLAIDYPWFHEGYKGDPIVEPPMNFWQRIFVVNRSFLQQVVGDARDDKDDDNDNNDKEDIDMARFLARQEPGGSGGLALGFRAIRDGHGFRNDGSEQYGDFLVANWLYAPNIRERDLGWAREGEEMYLHGDTVWQQALERMRFVLEWGQEHDVLIVGFLPPYMPTLWAEYGSDPRNSYLSATRDTLQALFKDYDFPLFDFSDATVLGASDEDFFDGWHASERVTLQMLIEMARQVPVLQTYSDPDALQAIHDSATDTFRVFPFGGQ